LNRRPGIVRLEHTKVSLPRDLANSAGDIGAGHVLGRYELLMPIASGGMAMVWAARLKGTRGFQKIVAVKTMLPKLSEDDQFEQMFLDEASLASQIRHPHVVEIMDLGEEDGILYLVMEMVDGVPLNQLMKAAKKRGGIPLPIAVRVVIQACAGLHAAHELKDRDGKLVGLVHRDVSPQNILVTYDGVTKVVDFGIAKATALGGGATVAGQIKGKVAYMSPEQVKGGKIDRRVDVFAIGIVLYALTTGKHPLRRESEAATMYNICSPEAVMPPSKIIQGYPAQLEKVVLGALAKDVDKRYKSCNDLLRALDSLPSSMRASTDEDVGNFVKDLFAERRDERQGALRHALDLADRQDKDEQRTLRMPTGATETMSGVSGIAQVPTDTSKVSSVSAEDIQGSLPGASTLDTDAIQLAANAGRRRLLYTVGALGLLALGGAIFAMATASGKADPHAGGQPSTEPASPPAPSEARKGDQDDVAAVDLGSLPKAKGEPDEADPDEGDTKKADAPPPPDPGPLPTSKPVWTAPPRPVPSPTAKPVPKPDPSPSESWDKQNPGF
jgi:serine/threonine protein kinase